jgi:hypothetical protein
MKGEVMKELSNNQKATILYDALPNYYIKKMKEANTEPIEMSLEDLFQFALNIEEAVINPGKDSEGNPPDSKELNYTYINAFIHDTSLYLNRSICPTL